MTHLISNCRLVRNKSLLRILYTGFQGNLKSSTESFFFDLVNICRLSEHEDTM